MGDPSSGKLFICYRRADSADITGRFYDRLVARFGRERVFKDVDSIPLGVDFRRHVDGTIQQCSATIVIIGREWLTAKNAAGGRRIDDELDHVRLEIQAAIKRDVPIIPVLVHEVEHPAPHLLPESLRELSFRNGATIRSDPHFNADVNHIISHLERLLAPPPVAEVGLPPPALPPAGLGPSLPPKAARAIPRTEPETTPPRAAPPSVDPVGGPRPAGRPEPVPPQKARGFRTIVVILAVLGALVVVGGIAEAIFQPVRSVREAATEQAILNNLRMLGAASDQYYLENGVGTVRLDQLVGSNSYVKVLKSVAGEDYGQVEFRQGQPLVIRTPDGHEIKYAP